MSNNTISTPSGSVQETRERLGAAPSTSDAAVGEDARLLTMLATAIETYWEQFDIAPSDELAPARLPSEIDADITLTEAQYSAAVALFAIESGCSFEAIASIAENRQWLRFAHAIGAEPFGLSMYLREKGHI